MECERVGKLLGSFWFEVYIGKYQSHTMRYCNTKTGTNQTARSVRFIHL